MSDPTLAPTAAPPGWMTFEFPGNERIRSFMRIENIFQRCQRCTEETSIHSHLAALWSLFELYDLVSGRGDVKSELMQEIDRQRGRISSYAGRPGVSVDALETLMEKFQRAFEALSSTQTRLGPHIEEYEWLQQVKGRYGIPGGICEFDIPLLHVWLHRSVETRQQMLAKWISALAPIHDGVALVLKLLREGTQPQAYVATRGYFELSMDGRQSQIIRVSVPKQPEVVAEISANKYVIAVRFRQPDAHMHLKTIEQDIPFQLTQCNF